MIPTIRALLAATILMTAAAPAVAQVSGASQEVLAQQQAVIADLKRRIEELERSMAGMVVAAQAPATTTQAAAPIPAVSAAAPARRPDAAPRPGEVVVDEAVVQRALERALVQTGALLLPPGGMEVMPTAGFVFNETSVPQVSGGDVVSTTVRRRSVEAGATFRLGLPYDSQVDVEVPFGHESWTTTDRTGFVGTTESTRSATGLGDVGVTLTKALMRERGAYPDLYAAVGWSSASGAEEDGIDVGSGFHEFTGRLTAVKRIDPLAYVGSLSYTHALERGGFQPGDEYGVSLGAVLATSPDTSLRGMLTQTFGQAGEFEGREVVGDDTVAATLTVGGSILLDPSTLLDVSVDMGLTDDAPDYAFRVAIPIRFGGETAGR